ncbi:MAG: type II secretion system F family protein [Rhodospirillales bacterium]
MKLADMLPFGLEPEQAVTALASLVAFALVIVVWNTLLAKDPMDGRLKRMARRRQELRAGWVRPRGHKLRMKSTKTAMRTLVQHFNLLRSKTTSKMTDKLARAGWRSRDSVVVYLFCKLCMPFVFGIASYVCFNLLKLFGLPPVAQTLAPLVGVAIGAYAPDMFVKNAIQKREKALTQGLPDTLDLLVICAEAGLSLDAALTRVANEMARSCPEIADEFGLAAVELGFLPDRRKALENLSRRVELASIRGIVTTLLQTEKYGTPLANSLRVLSAEFRNERMMKAEEKAARLPAILTVPMIIFILPTLLIVLIGPGIMRVMDSMGRM